MDDENSPSPELRAHLRRTWELELLISGALVFTLFQVPSALDQGFDRLTVRLSEDQAFTSFFFFTYSKMIIFVLIAAFLLHLLARSYWVGLIGLRSAFPQGVRWQELRHGKIFTEELRRLPGIDEQIGRTDRLASSIFSFAFLLVYFFLLSVAMVGTFAVIAWALTATVLPGLRIELLFWVLMVLSALPTTLPTYIDKSYQRRGKEPPPRLARWLRPMLRGYLRVIQAPLYAPVFYTFVTNLKSRRAYLLIGSALALLFVGFFSHLTLTKRARGALHGYAYLPPADGPLTVSDRFYDNLRSTEPSRLSRDARLPSLSSDVAEGPFLKLFLPYMPSRDNAWLEAACPEVEPWPWQLRRSEKPVSREEEQTAIECLSRLYSLELDGHELTVEPVLSRHPDTGARGLLVYLPTSQLEAGRHQLSITLHLAEGDEPRLYQLPFFR